MLAEFSAYAGLFFWSFLAATVVPLGSEPALIALVKSEQQIFTPILVATAGNYLGSCTTYWLGKRAAHVLEKQQRMKVSWGEKHAARWMGRFGQPVLLLSWVPFVGDALVALAGALKVPFGAFSAWILVGKTMRYLAVAWAARAI